MSSFNDLRTRVRGPISASARRTSTLGALCALLASACATDAAPPAATVLHASVLYEGKPYTATLTVVAERPGGDVTRASRSGTQIALPVDGPATITIDAMLPPSDGDSVRFRDIIPEFIMPAASPGIGETLHIAIDLPTPATTVPFAPTVLVRGAKASAVVQNTVARDTNGRVMLTSVVQSVDGLPVIADGFYSGLDAPNGLRDTLAQDLICADVCGHLFPRNVDCSFHCITCSSTSTLVGNVYKGNYNLCEITAAGGGGATTVQSVFDRFAAGEGGVHLDVLLRNGRAAKPRQLVLSALGARGDSGRVSLAAPHFVRRHPEFVVREGEYLYELTPAVDSMVTLHLPVRVVNGRITALHVELGGIDSLRGSGPALIADNRLGVVRRDISVNRSRDRLSISVAAYGADPGSAWVLLSVPADRTVREATIREDARPPRRAQRGTDYVIQVINGTRALVLRADAGNTNLDLVLAPG